MIGKSFFSFFFILKVFLYYLAYVDENQPFRRNLAILQNVDVMSIASLIK